MRYLVMFLTCLLGACSGQRPATLGVVDGRLAPCPGTPNCVSSFDTDDKHSIAPLPGSLDQIASFIGRRKDATIVTRQENYLHAEFRSRVMGFVDDVEFLAGKEGDVQVRSASRLGFSDFGVNRRRVEALREALRSAGQE